MISDSNRKALLAVMRKCLEVSNCGVCGGDADVHDSKDVNNKAKHEENCPVPLVVDACVEEDIDFYKIIGAEDPDPA